MYENVLKNLEALYILNKHVALEGLGENNFCYRCLTMLDNYITSNKRCRYCNQKFFETNKMTAGRYYIKENKICD